MEVSCTSCPARFAVPDDKVRGRKVRIKCKRCEAPIVIDGTHLGGDAAPGSKPAPAATAPKPAAAKPAAAPLPAAAPKPATTPLAAAKPAPQPAVKPAAQPAAKAEPAAIPKPLVGASPKPAVAAPTVAKAPEPAAKLRAEAAPIGTRPSATATAPVAPAAPPKREEKSSPFAARSAPAAAPAPAPAPAPAAQAKPTGWREPAQATPAIPTPMVRTGVTVPRPGGALASSPQTAPAPRPASNKRTMLGGLEPPPAPPQPTAQSSIKRTMLGMPMPGPAPAAPTPKPPEPEPEADTDAGDEPEWTVALTDDQHEEMKTTEVVELFARGTIDHETFIWADGMEDWKRPWEIPLISAALSARGLRAPTAEEARSSPVASREPEADDQTIVASVRFGPSSGRVSSPSGVWHEPGRDDDDEDRGVGFDDVTVSLDTREARQLMRAAAGEPLEDDDDGEDATDSVEYTDDASQDDLPTQVHDFEGFGEGVDGLLSGMDDPTGQSFHAESRPLSDWPTVNAAVPDIPKPPPHAALPNYDDEDQTTIHEQSMGAGYTLPTSPLVANQQQLNRLDALIDSAARMAPPVSTPPTAPLTGPYPSMPMSIGPSLPVQKKSGSLWWLWLLIFVLLVAGAAAASFYLKQPPSLYGPDGMPKIPFKI